MGSLSIPASWQTEGGGRTGGRPQLPAPPACSSWPRPALSRWLHRPRRAPAAARWRETGLPAPPPCPLIGSRRRPSAQRASPEVPSLLPAPLRCRDLEEAKAARGGLLRTSTPTLRERLAINRRGPSYLNKACVSWNQSFSEDRSGNWGCFTSPSTFFVRDHEEASLRAPLVSKKIITFSTARSVQSPPLQQNGAG